MITNATLRLIDKYMKIIKSAPSNDSVQLVPGGSIADVGLNINNAEHELEQMKSYVTEQNCFLRQMQARRFFKDHKSLI